MIAGIDLAGRNVVVTGGHAGLGLETTRALSRAGASVIVGVRNPDRAAPALAGLERVEISRLDLLDPMSIDAFVARFRDTGRPLHVLVNNAGIMGGRCSAMPAATKTVRDQPPRSLPTDPRPAARTAVRGRRRVVEVSSWGHHLSDIRWNDLHFETGYDGMVAYGQAKTANVLFAVELDHRWAGDGIRGYSLNPGQIVGTSLAPWLGEPELRAMGLIDDSGQPIIDPGRDMKTAAQGASTSVFAATSPLLADIGGVYLKDNDVAVLDDMTITADPDIAAGPAHRCRSRAVRGRPGIGAAPVGAQRATDQGVVAPPAAPRADAKAPNRAE